MSSELFMFLLVVFITVFVGGLTGLGFRKWYRSPLKKKINSNTREIELLSGIWNILNKHRDDMADIRKLANNTDSGLQSLYEVVRNIDKDVKRLKNKAKGKSIDIDGKSITSEVIPGTESFGGVSVMNCSNLPYCEIPSKNGYRRVNDPEYLYYHGNNIEAPGSTYKQIEFDNSTDMFTITLNDGRKIASDITHIKDLLLKEANKLQ